MMSHDDIFALTPRLLSLHLRHADDSATEVQCRLLLIEFDRILHSLSYLASLQCQEVRIDIADVLDIALHPTLGWLHIEATGRQVVGAESGSTAFSFSAMQAGERPPQQAAADVEVDECEGAFDDEPRVEAEQPLDGAAALLRSQFAGHLEASECGRYAEWELQRMYTALTRTQPTQRS